MKVAHLTTVDLSLRFLLLAQLRAVVDAGGEAIGISAPGPWVADLEAAGVRHVPLSSSTRGVDPAADLRTAADLRRVLRRERPDVLHTHNPKPGVYGRVVGRLCRVPIVVNTVHGLWATETDPVAKRVAVYAAEAVAARFSDAELFQNPEDLALACRWRITPPARARLLGNGVDLARFTPGRLDAVGRRALRAELGVDDDVVLVGAVGRLVAEKGYPELFDAMRRLGPGYALVAAGPDDPAKPDALSRAVLDDAARRGVRLLGMRDDVDRLYGAMDAFVLASHREGYPRAAMEAAASGLPLVVTDVRGCREVVDHEVNGLRVPVRDAGALAGAIRRLGDDPEGRARMGAESRRIAEARFDERRVVEIVMATYREVADRKGLRLG